MTTHKQRTATVEAVQCVCGYGDDERLIGVNDDLANMAWDDHKIGGKHRDALASMLRYVRKFHPEIFNDVYRKPMKSFRRAMLKNPRRHGLFTGETRRAPKRLHSSTVSRKRKPASRHQDCVYCGYGGDGIHICGMCRIHGIDGPVIPGTSQAKATTYIRWTVKKNKS